MYQIKNKNFVIIEFIKKRGIERSVRNHPDRT